MAEIIGLDGKKIVTPQQEFVESKFVDGKRVILTILEDEKDHSLMVMPGIKPLMNPFKLERMLRDVHEDVVKGNIQGMIIKTASDMIERAEQQRQEKAMIAAAMYDVTSKPS